MKLVGEAFQWFSKMLPSPRMSKDYATWKGYDRCEVSSVVVFICFSGLRGQRIDLGYPTCLKAVRP